MGDMDFKMAATASGLTAIQVRKFVSLVCFLISDFHCWLFLQVYEN